MKVIFDWDDGNDTKNYTKHGVSCLEAESVFQDKFRLDFNDPLHTSVENRFITIGSSNRPRVLLLAWTLSKTKVRIISARPASKKERCVYEEKKKNQRKE